MRTATAMVYKMQRRRERLRIRRGGHAADRWRTGGRASPSLFRMPSQPPTLRPDRSRRRCGRGGAGRGEDVAKTWQGRVRACMCVRGRACPVTPTAQRHPTHVPSGNCGVSTGGMHCVYSYVGVGVGVGVGSGVGGRVETHHLTPRSSSSILSSFTFIDSRSSAPTNKAKPG